MIISSSLRRQSSPLARIIRDFIVLKRPLLALAVGSAIFLGMIGITQQKTSDSDSQILPRTEKVENRE
jgi:hypothetical protein